jgi:hypothetical protein
MSEHNSRERVLARQRDLERSFGLPAGGQGLPSGETVSLTAEQLRARKRRSVWIALAVGGFMALVFAITLAQMNAGVVAGLAAQ